MTFVFYLRVIEFTYILELNSLMIFNQLRVKIAKILFLFIMKIISL